MRKLSQPTPARSSALALLRLAMLALAPSTLWADALCERVFRAEVTNVTTLEIREGACGASEEEYGGVSRYVLHLWDSKTIASTAPCIAYRYRLTAAEDFPWQPWRTGVTCDERVISLHGTGEQNQQMNEYLQSVGRFRPEPAPPEVSNGAGRQPPAERSDHGSAKADPDRSTPRPPDPAPARPDQPTASPQPSEPAPVSRGTVAEEIARVVARRDGGPNGPRFVPLPTGSVPEFAPSSAVALTASQRGSYPIRAVAQVVSRYGYCLAVFTGPRELRTAGHCVLTESGTAGRVMAPSELEIRLWPEAAARVGQRTARVIAVETQPGWPAEPQLGYLANEGVTLRIREPLGTQLGYFGLYRQRAGALGSLGGDNLTGLCAYETQNAPILSSEWRDPVNYELAMTAALFRPRLNYALLNRTGGRLASYGCWIGVDRARHPKDRNGEFLAEPFVSGRLDLRVATCRIDTVMSHVRFVTDEPCDPKSGDSGLPLFILDGGLPVLVGNLYGGGQATESELGRGSPLASLTRELSGSEQPLLSEREFPFVDGKLPDVLRYPVSGPPEVVWRTGTLLPFIAEGVDWLVEGDARFYAGEYDRAASAYEKAREYGHYRAPWALFYLHSNGLIAGVDESRWLDWLLEAAELGCPNGQAHAADVYLGSELVPQDIDKALDLLERATAQQAGSKYPGAKTPHANTLLGYLNTGQLGFASDFEEAERLLGQAVWSHDQSPDAMIELFKLHCASEYRSAEKCQEIGWPMAFRAVRFPNMTAARHGLGQRIERTSAHALWTIAAEEGHEEAASAVAAMTLTEEEAAEARKKLDLLRQDIEQNRRRGGPQGYPSCFSSDYPFWMLGEKTLTDERKQKLRAGAL